MHRLLFLLSLRQDEDFEYVKHLILQPLRTRDTYKKGNTVPGSSQALKSPQNSKAPSKWVECCIVVLLLTNWKEMYFEKQNFTLHFNSNILCYFWCRTPSPPPFFFFFLLYPPKLWALLEYSFCFKLLSSECSREFTRVPAEMLQSQSQARRKRSSVLMPSSEVSNETWGKETPNLLNSKLWTSCLFSHPNHNIHLDIKKRQRMPK